MGNKVMVLAGVGVLGFIIYKMMNQNPMDQSNLSYAASSNVLTQPSQLYPFQPVQAPRVDYGATANQPWSQSSASSVNKASGVPSMDMNFTQNVAYVKGAADIVSSVGDIWSSVASWFEPEQVDSVDQWAWGDWSDEAFWS